MLQIYNNKAPKTYLKKVYLPGTFYLSYSFSSPKDSNILQFKDLGKIKYDKSLPNVNSCELEEYRIYFLNNNPLLVRIRINDAIYGIYYNGIEYKNKAVNYFDWETFTPSPYFLNRLSNQIIEQLTFGRFMYASSISK